MTSAIVHCVGDVAHWNERSFLRQGVVAQGWLLRVSAHSSAHADYTLGSNREALLAPLLPTVAPFGFTASPLHPFAEAKAIAQVDATFWTCRFCRPGALRASVLITLGRKRIVIRSIVHDNSLVACISLGPNVRAFDAQKQQTPWLWQNGKTTRAPRSWLCRYPTGGHRSCCVRRRRTQVHITPIPYPQSTELHLGDLKSGRG